MKVLYTGAKSKKHLQAEPSLSLGGIVSASPVPNDFFSSLFQEITNETIRQNKKEVICLGIENDGSLAINITTLTLGQTKDSFSQYRIGVVAAVEDASCGDQHVPKMANKNSLPVSVEFHKADSAFGESLISINESLVSSGDELTIKAAGTAVCSLVWDGVLNDNIVNIGNNGYELKRRFVKSKKAFDLFLVQEDLINFETDLSIVNSSDVEVGTFNNTQPDVNKVTVSGINSGSTIGIYIERTMKFQTMKDFASDKEGELLFALNSVEDAKLDEDEIANLIIEYDEIPAS